MLRVSPLPQIFNAGVNSTAERNWACPAVFKGCYLHCSRFRDFLLHLQFIKLRAFIVSSYRLSGSLSCRERSFWHWDRSHWFVGLYGSHTAIQYVLNSAPDARPGSNPAACHRLVRLNLLLNSNGPGSLDEAGVKRAGAQQRR